MRPDSTIALRRLIAGVAVATAAAAAVPATATAGRADDARVQRGLERLVEAPGGPPGAIATLHRDGRTSVLTAGVSEVGTQRAPRADDHMRIASIAKAFSGAVALRLVRDGQLSLDDTIASRLPELPAAWGSVTVAQLLNHTSGVPDYTQSDGFREQLETDPQGFVAPTEIISWVASAPLEFAPGSSYEYSNTDNIIVGLIAERVTGRPYGDLLREIVFEPLGLRRTSFPTDPPLPRPFLHGYQVEPGQPPQDVSELLSPSGAWASGAIVSTPARAQRVHPRLPLGSPGRQGAPAPAAALRRGRAVEPARARAPTPRGSRVFRYRSRCGTVYGHTGNFPGYVQWAAATRDGSRAVTTSLNIPAPTGALLARLRATQADAVCALLRR